MVERKPAAKGTNLHPETELPVAPHPGSFSFPAPRHEPPALIAGKDLEHYWNAVKWPALTAAVIQAFLFTANQPASYEWLVTLVLARYLAAAARRMHADRSYQLALTAFGGAANGVALAAAHLLLGWKVVYLFEFIRLPVETAILVMLLGTVPDVLFDRFRARQHRTPPPNSPTPGEFHG